MMLQQLWQSHRLPVCYCKLQHPVALLMHLFDQFHSRSNSISYTFNKLNAFQLKDEPWMCICLKKLRKQFQNLRYAMCTAQYPLSCVCVCVRVSRQMQKK